MADYRDYGSMTGFTAPSIAVDTVRYTQVFKATHDSEGILLPSLYRSFISFSFGGKNIEDFNLIAYCDGDRMSRNGSSNFEDLVTSYDIMDGQYYHGTHFSPFELSLKLVTDGIDQKQLDEFLYWFRGGMTRELILAEHPNRAIMARVSAPPALEVLPFEQPIEVKIGINTYKTSTTLYKGTIDLDFVADTPFWYAKTNIFQQDPTTGETLYGGLNLLTNEKARLDALKIIYEDNIPSVDLVATTMHFGTNLYALIGQDVVFSKIAGPYKEDQPTVRPENWDTLIQNVGYFTEIVNGVTEYWCGAKTYKNQILGRIAGTTFDEEANVAGDTVPANNSNYQFFYGGTAPSPTILSFSINLTPSGSNYINCIANSYAKNDDKEYSTITIESEHKKEFQFTTPNVITSWNKTYKMLNSIETRTSHTNEEDNSVYYTGTNWSDLADNLRDYVRHPAVRAFVIGIINHLQSINTGTSGDKPYFDKDDGIFLSAGKSQCITLFKRFFQKFDVTEQTWSYSDADFVFNAEAGLALGTFKYWQASSSDVNIATIISGTPSVNDVLNNFVAHTENVGDMLRSNWLIIEDQNRLNNGLVRAWTDSAKYNAHTLKHDLPVPITNLKIEYKNMYL